MNLPHSLRVALLLPLLALTASAPAQPPRLLPGDLLDPTQLLPPPPARGSAEANQELETVLRVQATRTPEDIARMKSEEKLTLAAFTPAMGPWFTAENLPQTDRLFNTLAKELKQYSDKAKQYFERVRPAVVDRRIQPLIDEGGLAYPSGHATRGMFFAVLFAELAPERRDALAQRGLEIGWDRVIGGVHVPSDLTAGRVLGKALAEKLLGRPDFRQQLEGLKAEWDHARQAAAK